MATYVFRDGEMVEKATGAPITFIRNDPVSLPYVRGDLPAYRSPITGEVIEGRRARREDLAKHGCREVDPSENTREFRTEKYQRAAWKRQKMLRGET